MGRFFSGGFVFHPPDGFPQTFPGHHVAESFVEVGFLGGNERLALAKDLVVRQIALDGQLNFTSARS